MKRTQRILSLLLALVLLCGLLPWELIPRAAAAEPAAETGQAAPEAASPAAPGDPVQTPQPEEPKTEDLTDLTIYFNQQTATFEETLRQKAEETMHLQNVNTAIYGEDYYESNYNNFKWNHVTGWSVKNDDGRDDVGVLLASTDPRDKYIVLDRSDNHSYDNTKLWETIVITEDKVLDLNGRTLNMRYDANLNQAEDGQTTHAEYHNCVAFEITNNATLTIIDSSAWRSASGKGTGRISFTAYMVNAHTADINYYTTRDLFHVEWGNLVIYGGEYQAGRKKDQLKKNFTWDKLRTTIGSAVGLGVNIAEYATGVGVATAAFKDEVAKQTNTSAYNENTETGDKDDHSDGTETMIRRDGSNLDPKDTTMVNSAHGAASENQTVNQLKNEKDTSIAGGHTGTVEGTNTSNDKGTGKDDSNTRVAKKEKEMVNQIVNKSSIMGMVDGVFDLIGNIAGMCGADEKTRVTNSIKGTVVKVGNQGCFVAYGGTFMGYGSTPNTRNAVVEVSHLSRNKTWDASKSNGGVAYIYGGTFEGYNGANIFNMVNSDPGPQYAMEQIASGYGPAWGSLDQLKRLDDSETGGVEVLYYENQAELSDPNVDLDSFVPQPINTANVQVRGGTFRCFYDIMNVAIKEEGDDQHFTKFPGTMGSVNLGIESYGENLIQDGRIQIVDRYGDGALVLLDDRSDEKAAWEAEHPGETFPEALYHYRLFCGDSEMRAKSYLTVSPNTAVTNSSASMQLCTYDGDNKKTTQLWVNDGDNIRAPARQTEPYFDYIYDEDSSDSWSVMPNFYNSVQSQLDVYGQFLDSNEVWYYPVPRDAGGNPIEAEPYGEAYFTCAGKYTPENDGIKVCSQQVNTEGYWPYALREIAAPGTVQYYLESHDDIRNNIRYFTYRVYRVDPITRESLSENPYYGTDEPLVQATIGCNNGDALKIKLPLKEIERQIRAKRGSFSYQSGEMYRVVFTCDEFLGWGYQGNGVFGGKAGTAHSEATILFRCINHNETVNNGGLYADKDFTSLQWIAKPDAGRTASINLVNGKAGMTDYRADCKIFDVYYQWYEVDADGSNPRLFAGTDNVYDVSGDDPEYDGNWENHKPNLWNVGTDGKQYLNTVDPADPNASTYLYNGLPGHYDDQGVLVPDKNLWKAEQIHLYSKGTTSSADYTLWNGNLSLANNDIYKSNVDTCYIPTELAGKYVQVKCIVLNHRWPVAYDAMQTFTSHIVKVPEIPQPIRVEMDVAYQSGLNYASAVHPAAVSLKTITGLGAGEYITGVWTYAGYSPSFEDLEIRQPSDFTALRYPQDFFPADYDFSSYYAGQKSIWIYVETNKGRHAESDVQLFNYAIEATGYTKHLSDVSYRLSEIPENGLLEGDYQVFRVTPKKATVGYDFVKDSSTTNRNVAYLNAQGCLVWGGSCGSATVSIKGPDNVTRSINITVIQDFNHVEITGIKAPVRGETLQYEASVPEDAPYRIKRIEWDGRTEDMTQYPVEKFLKYTVTVVIERKEGVYFDFDNADYSLTCEDYEGGEETVTEPCRNNPNVVDFPSRNEYYFSFTYPGIGEDEPYATINELHLDFPTQVPEGTSWEEWVSKRLHVYSDGYDDHYTYRVYPTYASTGDVRLDTCGDEFYRTIEPEKDGSTCFLKGVQTGLCLEIEVDCEEYQDVFASDPTVYINGVEGLENESFVSGEYTRFYIYARDTITVTDGTPPDPMPKVYRAKDVNWVTGTTSSPCSNDVTAFYACDDPRVSFSYSAPYAGNSDTEQSLVNTIVSFDPNALTLTLQPMIAGNAFANSNFLACIDVTANFDRNGDGWPEYKEVYQLGIYPGNCYLYESSVPAAESRSLSFQFYDPSGAPARTDTLSYTNGVLSLPELEGCFVTGFWSGSEKKSLLSNYGLSRVYVPAAGTYTVRTVSAEALEIHPGATEVYCFVKGADGNDVPCVQISVDGVHYYQDDHISGLSADTAYTLYYRQGIDGTVYTMRFHTAAREYGLRVGRIPVTNENLGILDYDGWQYYPNVGILYLNDFNLIDTGSAARPEDGFIMEVSSRTLIYSSGNLILYLMGDAVLERKPASDDWFVNYDVYAEGNLSISGSGGSLTVNGTEYLDAVFFSANGNITVNTGSKITVNCGTCFSAPNGTITYRYGDIDFRAYLREINGNYYQVGGLVPHLQVENFTISPSHSTMTYEVAGKDGVYYTKTKDEFLTQLYDNFESYYPKQSARMTATHSFTQQNNNVKYLVSGTCGGSLTYHYSCSVCGAEGTNTYTTTLADHNLAHYDAHPATCNEAGYDEYWRCSACGYSTFWQNFSPALGHSWTHHDALPPSCAVDGHPAYDVCSRCGLSSAVTLPTDLEIAQGTANPELIAWKAAGHACSYVPATAPGCTADGTRFYYLCARCGQASYDPKGKVPMTDGERLSPALGHDWGEWEILESAPTVMTSTCARCGEARTKALVDPGIPIDEEHFPDEYFRYYLSDASCDQDGNGYLNPDEIAAITELDLASCDIETLEGIQYLTAATWLSAGWNNITSLDLSGNPAMSSVNLDGNPLAELDLTGPTALKSLSVSETGLTALDLSDCTALEILDVSGSYVAALDLSDCAALTHLYCSDACIESLDLSGNPALIGVYAGLNPLTELDLTGLTSLKQLYLDGTELTELDLTGLTALKELNLSSTGLTELDVSGLPALEQLYVTYTPLSSLTLANASLWKLQADHDLQLGLLDISRCPLLVYDVNHGTRTTYQDGSGYHVTYYIRSGSSYTHYLSYTTGTRLYMERPADGFYLIGRRGWTIYDITPEVDAFEPNPGVSGEYMMLGPWLDEGETLKVVKVQNGEIVRWYPEGTGNEYVVTAEHATCVDIYFRETYQSAWAEFGGYIWIENEHLHSEVYVEAVEPSCTEPGHVEYWYCSDPDCPDHGKYFSDENLENEIEDITIPALGHQPGEPEEENYVAPTPTTAGGYDTVVYCQRCDAELSREHTVLPATAPIETANLEIFYSISVGTDMIISFNTAKASLTNYEKFWIEVIKHEPTEDKVYKYGVDQEEALIDSNQSWKARFNHIFAKEMGLDVEARVYAQDANGRVYMSPAKIATIRDYLGGRLTATTNKVEQRVLAADMLNYGAAAQLFLDYDTDHLVNEELTAEQLAKLDQYETKDLPLVEKTNSNYKPEGATDILFTSVTLGNEVQLKLNVNLPGATEGVQVLVKDHATGNTVTTLETNYSGSSFRAVFIDIGAAKMRVEYDFVTLVNGVETGNTRTWSVEAYVGEIRAGNKPLKTDLANALLTYGDAAAAYKAAQQAGQ